MPEQVSGGRAISDDLRRIRECNLGPDECPVCDERLERLIAALDASEARAEAAEAERDELADRLSAMMGWPWAFVLQRDEDVTGVSGTGVVAEGVEFSDGTVALRWISEWPTSVVFHDRGLDAVKAVHGHDGRTQIVMVPPAAWADAQPQPTPSRKDEK